MTSSRFDLPHPERFTLHRMARREEGNQEASGDFHAHWGTGGNLSGLHSEPTLSVVIPARNEAEALPRLVSELVSALRRCERPKSGYLGQAWGGFEIIVVDDGSYDETPVVLESLKREVVELRSLRLVEPAGQSAALVAGFMAARGDWIATLDGDLQNDPADLPRLWRRVQGNGVVLGWRVRRKDHWSRWVISLLANRIRNQVLGQAIRDTGCSVRLMPRAVALQLPKFQGFHRFFGPLLIRQGCPIIQVPVRHRPRRYGSSHYNIWNRSVHVVVDLLGVLWLMNRPVRYLIAEEAPFAPERLRAQLVQHCEQPLAPSST